MYLRVTLVIRVGRALKSRKLMPCFIGPYQILQRIGEVDYQIVLLPLLANLHDVFHVSQLRRYISDPSHMIKVGEVRENLDVEASPMWVEDRKVKQLCGKKIILVKVVWE